MAGAQRIDFDAAFGGVLRVQVGQTIPDPLSELSPDEQRLYHSQLADVVRAQDYAAYRGLRRGDLVRAA